MSNRRSDYWTRREFVRTAALAGTGSLWGFRSESLAAEPALETTTLRIVQTTGTCFAPQYLAEDLLRAEGFSDVQYVMSRRKIRLSSWPESTLAALKSSGMPGSVQSVT